MVTSSGALSTKVQVELESVPLLPTDVSGMQDSQDAVTSPCDLLSRTGFRNIAGLAENDTAALLPRC